MKRAPDSRALDRPSSPGLLLLLCLKIKTMPDPGLQQCGHCKGRQLLPSGARGGPPAILQGAGSEGKGRTGRWHGERHEGRRSAWKIKNREQLGKHGSPEPCLGGPGTAHRGSLGGVGSRASTVSGLSSLTAAACVQMQPTHQSGQSWLRLARISGYFLFTHVC